MMYSPTKAEDIGKRTKLLDQMKVDLAQGLTAVAKAGGRMAQILGERIKMHDYSEEDARYFRLKEMERHAAEIRAGIIKDYKQRWWEYKP